VVTRRGRSRTASEARADERLLGEAVRRLVEAVQPERIYLFGSRARGDAGRDSDFDFMVVVADERAGEVRALRRRAFEALRGLDIAADILVEPSLTIERRRPVVASLAATVEREGRLLYGDAPARVEVVDPVELEERKSELVREWLFRAEQDLLAAERVAAPPPLVNVVAFHAQQAAEKALKAYLVWHDRPLRKTHLLDALLEECVQISDDLASLASAARTLSPYAIAGRYPDDRVSLTERDAEQALELARAIVQFVRQQLP
jgi:HEPN domain-containing protein/predicted nucleotidyltransferase